MDYLIVSDYDGTMKKKGDVSDIKKNVEILRGILDDRIGFMISTGRLYKSLTYEVSNYDIPFDYVSCANGNILFDKNLQSLFKTYIDSRIINDLKPFYDQIIDIFPLDEYGSLTSKAPTEYLIQLIDDKQVRKMVVEMLLKSKVFDYCTDGSSKYLIHIFKLSSKIDTIDIVKNKIQLDNSKIYSVGDGPNDIEMLKKYNGSIIGNSLDDAQEMECIQKYDSFGDYIGNMKKVLKRELK